MWLLTDELYRIRADSAGDVTEWGPIDGVGTLIAGAAGTGRSLEESTVEVSALSGASSIPVPNLVPAGSLIISVTLFVKVNFGTSNGLTGLNLGDIEVEDRWGNGISPVITPGSGPGSFNAYAPFPVRTTYSPTISTTSGRFDSLGTANVTAHYETFVPSSI